MEKSAVAVVMTMVGLAAFGPGTVAADDPTTEDLVCGSGDLVDSCAGPGAQCDVTLANCEDSGPKCRWYNAWEADVEAGTDPDAVLEGGFASDAGSWEVAGQMGCGSETPKECSVDSNPDACGPLEDTGSGDLKCDLTVRVGIVPENVWVEITCKDPVNPCAFVSTRIEGVPEGEEIVPVQTWHPCP